MTKNTMKAKMAAVVAGVMALTVAVQGVSWNALFDGKTAKGFGLVAEASENPGGWVHFYNDDLQNDGIKGNDFNFGPNPYSSGKSVSEYDAEFRERLKWDTALAAASTAWLDANVGTRYLGEFYESCKGDWAKTMNEAKETFAKDQEAYYKNLDAFFAYLDAAESVDVRKCSGVTDQMYMNPYTPAVGMQMPDIIVLKTHKQKGHELVYTFNIKGEKFKVAFRIECGFQPTNVSKVMHITPEGKDTATTPRKTTSKTTPKGKPGKKTTPKGQPGKKTTPEGKSGKKTTPEGKDDDKTTPEKDKDDKTTPEQGGKDPSKAPDENTEPNDNPGPGPDTNSGGNESTEDQPSNSNHYDSYDDYRNDVDDLADTNANQQTPQNNPSNTPTTETPANTNVDNNGTNGTGNGGIDKPTETSAPATEADTNKPIVDTATDHIDEPK